MHIVMHYTRAQRESSV